MNPPAISRRGVRARVGHNPHKGGLLGDNEQVYRKRYTNMPQPSQTIIGLCVDGGRIYTAAPSVGALLWDSGEGRRWSKERGP